MRGRVATLAALLVFQTGEVDGQYVDINEPVAIGVNALLGAVTSGITASLQGDPFFPAFLRGSGGGTLVYAGKKVAAARFSGAGLMGRQVAAVGTSVVRNA